MTIKNQTERDRVIDAFRAAPDKALSRRPVKNRYVDDSMRGNLAAVGIRRFGLVDMWITVNVDTTECWFYAPASGGGPILVHEEKNVEIRDLVAECVAKLAPRYYCDHDWKQDPTCDLIDVCPKCGAERA